MKDILGQNKTNSAFGNGYSRVQKEAFDLNLAQAELMQSGENIGAISAFIGYVRPFSEGNEHDNNPQKALQALHLEHYPEMTERILEDIRQQAITRWNLSGAILIHRIGKLTIGDCIVLVITASPHRNDAISSCSFLIDWLKTDAPFWKAEESLDGQLQWVESKLSDQLERTKWLK